MQANLPARTPRRRKRDDCSNFVDDVSTIVRVRPNKGDVPCNVLDLQQMPIVFVALRGFDINQSEITPIWRLTELGHHVAVPGDEETSATRIVSEAKENVDRDLICSGSSKMGNADIPWTHVHGSHMNRLWWPAHCPTRTSYFLVQLPASSASKPRLKSSSNTSRAPAGPDGTRDLRFLLSLPSAIALMTQNACQRRTSIPGLDRDSTLADRPDEGTIVMKILFAYSTANSHTASSKVVLEPM